jgi:hypothetical protein
MTRRLRDTTLERVETRRTFAGARPQRSSSRRFLMEIVVIVLIVLFIGGYFGRGRFRA